MEEHKNKFALDIQNTQSLCEVLMKTPHYRKLGEHGIFAIVQKALSLGINPLEALNGGMYFINGKVEMQSILMAKLIRQYGHSVRQGKGCDKNTCVLVGRRRDTGDEWEVSFTIDEAKKAGIYSPNNAWGKYPEDMLYSRALSRLARRLFPDVIGNCYVEGEIKDAPPLESAAVEDNSYEDSRDDIISTGEAEELDELIGSNEEYRSKVLNFIRKKYEARSLYEMPREIYDAVLRKAQMIADERDKEILKKEA